MEGLRRIVTGHNADGKSIVMIDGPPARQITDSEVVGGLFEIWNTDGNQINTLDKIDRADKRPDEVVNEVFDLFVSLEANDDQLDFPILYASGRSRSTRSI